MLRGDSGKFSISEPPLVVILLAGMPEWPNGTVRLVFQVLNESILKSFE